MYPLDKISIIVPVYNMEKYVDRCINSLLKQTYENIEIIIVDDGSKDNSWQILQKYNNNPKVKLFKKYNGGLSEARNFGLKKSSGNYISFVDSDDWVDDKFIELMYMPMKKHNADISLCNLQKVDENEIAFNPIIQLSHLGEKINLKKDFSIFGEASSFACNKLFKKELFQNIQFPPNLHFEDIATIPILFLNSKIITKTDSFLYNYFERRGSITQNFNTKGLDMFKAISIVRTKFEKSAFFNNSKQWKRFVIFQGYFSLLAYIIRIEDKTLRLKGYKMIEDLLKKENISKYDIFSYKRLNKNYINSLSLAKKIFYLLMIVFPKIILRYK